MSSHRRAWLRSALLALGLTALGGTGASGQGEPYTLRGSVVDAATQRPLVNVSVLLRGTQHGALTDNAGRFTLVARVQPGSYTLQFSLIGRGQATRPLTLGAERAVTLEPVALEATAVQMEEIVVTGTGAPTERRAVANAVATVRGSDVNEAPAATSVDRALQGKVTGALISQNSGAPGGGVTIRLRGTSSILGGADPLIVIDGVLVDNNSDALVALGANASRQGAAISNRLSDIAPGDVERIEVLKGAAAAALYGSRANNGVIQIFTKRGQQGRPRVSLRSETSVGRVAEQWPVLMSPNAGVGDSVFLGHRFGAPVTRYDIQDQIFQTAHTVNNQVSISGGSDQGTTYYLSGGWMEEDGVVRTTGHTKQNARVRVSQRVSPLLEVSANAQYIQSRTSYQPEGEQTQGALTVTLFTPTTYNPAFNEALGRYPYSPIVGTNPLQALRDFRAEASVNRFIGSVQTSLTPFDGLSLTYLFGLDTGREENLFLQPPYTINANFTGSIANPVRSIQKYNSDLTANYELDLAPGVELTSTGGVRFTSDRVNTVRAGASFLPPGQQTVGGATQFASQGIVELRTFGGFLQERVSVADQLFVTAGLNVDASSAFGADERWQLFPRLGASWVVNESPAWERSGLGSVLSSLRLRAAYGQTGGQPPAAYATFNNYVDNNFSGRAGLVASTVVGNPGLRPERQQEIEGGLDVGFWSDRAQLEVTAYHQRTSDLVLSVPLHPSTGFTNQFQNVGTLTNRGVEAALTANLVRGANLSWTSRLSYAANRNRVDALVGSSDTLVFEYMNAVIVGQPVGVFYGRRLARDAEGRPLLNALGRPYTATHPSGRQVFDILGDPNPDFTAALSNTVNVGRRLELSFLLDGRFGNDVANFTRRIQEYFGLAPNNEKEITGEVARGYYTLNTGRHVAFEEWVEDGSFVKLREASLSYRLDQPWVRRFGAESLDLRVSGRNLYTWTRYSGIDPELNLFSGSTVARGVEFITTPIPRTLTLGFTANF